MNDDWMEWQKKVIREDWEDMINGNQSATIVRETAAA
jgi:hypothetical protein